ncbi:MAG: lysophospholipid acyltransferase family protein [Alphaproteobacteria bacterium]|nr:lysophospholipid acyltransferase family protein [Alphaproteobacteria bacterium]
MPPRPSLLKSVGRRGPVQAAVAAVIAFYIRLVHKTGRWRVINAGAAARHWDEGKPFILAFWHGRLLMMPLIWRRGVPFSMLISQHRDGQLIARTVADFSLGVIKGSTRKARKKRETGGLAALRAMTRALKSGESVGITPDGPRGPRRAVSEGVVKLARLAGVPVIPAACSASPAHVVRSWDRFLVPLPFARGVFVWGEPMAPPTDESEEAAFRAALEAAIDAATERADAEVGAAAAAREPREAFADA